MSEMAPRKAFPDQSSGSGHSVTTSRQPYIIDSIASKRVCFYKSGDPQFNGLRMVINSRTFKTFDALLDSLSKKVPLPFGVRNITTPRGVHAVHNLDELEDGKAYICSDQRKVKPINLALANKKPPPWYHARPISARRQALQLARKYPGRPKRKQEPGVARPPKKLTVFRNGDPSVKHTVMLQRRTTPTFESLLDYVSELMQFPVVKLHTPDGGRVDGLPALILCSGKVVATGREAFKSANYNTQKSITPTWLPASRMAPKRKKHAIRKKKTMSSGSKSRNFSSSSERYFVNQIHNSVAGSLCDFPSNSGEMETGQLLESVAETEGDICLEEGVEGMESCMPEDDDIEKSFRVNQDGSMTVEMKVRLTIKEEETVHWTTTLTRSSVANQLSVSSLPESDPEGGTLEPQNSTSTDTINKHNFKDDDDHLPPENGLTSKGGNEEEESEDQADVVFPRRAPTPGPRRSRQNQASLESIKTVKPDEIQQNTVGSYSYREDTGTGKVTEEYCMVRQCSTRPVPKPRRVSSLDVNSYNRNPSSLKSAGEAEILQMDDSGGEITETVLHIYEQQTCRDNSLANSQFSVQGVSMYGLLYGRPATSDTAHFSSSYDFETELGRPSTASESLNVWKTDDTSSELTTKQLKTRKSFILTGQPDTKPVLEKLCYSIQSIRQLTQNKRRSCLEKSNSLPDFSSHVASTFGSSSKALLAFLTVMTLKEGIANFNTHELNANSVSCAEALKMIETLREIASMEDADKLQASLTDLQRSASIQLLQSWRGFQELSDKIKSRSSTPNSSEHNVLIGPCQKEELCNDENIINELIKEFDMPEELKEELAALPVIVEMESDEREKSMEVIKDSEINGHSTSILQEQIVNVDKGICNEEPNVDVKSIIKQFMNIQHAKEVIDMRVSPNTDCLSHRQKQMYPGNQILKEDKIYLSDRRSSKDNCSEHPLSEEEQTNSLADPLEHEEKRLNLPSSHKEKIDRENLEEDKKVNSDDHPSCIDPDDNLIELNRSRQDSLSSPEEYQLRSEEEIPEVESSKMMQVSNKEKPSTTAEKHPTFDEEHENPGLNNCPEQKFSESSEEHSVEEQASFEKEEPVVKYNELQVSSSNKSPPTLEEIQLNSLEDEENKQSPARCLEQRISSEESLCSPEDEEEEETEVKCEDLNVITEERDFSLEEKTRSEKEQEVHKDQLSNKEQVQEIKYSDLQVAGKERVSTFEVVKDNLDVEGCQADDLGYADVQTYEEQNIENESHSTVREKLSSFVEEPRIIIIEDTNCLRNISRTIEEHYSFDTYQTDSGNEHISCEEQDSAEIVNFENKLCSLEERHSTCMEEQSSSEEEHVSAKQYIEDSNAEYQDSYIEEEPSEEDINDQMTEGKMCCTSNKENTTIIRYEMNKEKQTCYSVVKPVPSVAERVGILEKKVSGSDQRKTVIVETPGIRRLAQIKTPIGSEADDLTNISQLSNEQGQIDDFMRESSEMRITNSALSAHSAPPSSLAFSYDSSGCLTRESERNKVQSIKEMFMAKSIADIQYGHRQLPSPNTSDLSDSRPETSDSGGHRSHVSPEVSSGEDESVIKSIAKGIVRRTIERLYGKRDDEVKDSNEERPPSPSKQRLRERAIRSILSPFHMAQSKVLSDLSYFNATSSFESYSEPTRCIAFNAQVGPGESVLIDKGRWLLNENAPIRKSISEPIAIHKGTELCTKTENECDDTKEEIPYSHFSMSTQNKDLSSELEDKTKPKVPRCTYFTLPHGSDSDLYQDEMRTAGRSGAKGDLMTEKQDKSEEGESKTWVEKNGKLPAFTPTDFKIMKDNKVHPLEDGPIEGQVVVVVQPGKGQTGLKGQTVVNRRPQEPDALEMLYVFCGQHCPVL
ncbi:oxygen-regulated protein 1-like [Osmerus mordax]|uniref:oxygen-regulated protein 1-like n=1 Tax=Osmerus mordax TaxID=8014 RepID=UPI0035104E84